MQPDHYVEYIKVPNGTLLQIKSVPTGGTKGQVLAKSSDRDADIDWVTPQVGITEEQLEEVKFLIPDVSGFATKTELETGLVSKQDAGTYANLEDVYTKDQTYSKDEVYNKEETYSKDEVYSKGETYSKEETYSKDETYTKSETIEQITKAVTEGAVDLEPYYDKTEVDALLDTKIDASNLAYFVSHTDFSVALELKADKADTLAGYGINDAYTKEEIDQKFVEYAPDLSEYYTKDEVYNKEEMDTQISQASTASANAVKNQNSNSTADLKFWVGTKEEYKAISTPDGNTVYHITNDMESGGLDLPTATVDELGVIKPDGVTVSVNEDGVLTANVPEIDTSNLANKADVYTKDEVFSKAEISEQFAQASAASASAVKNQNLSKTGDLKFWVGTQSEYLQAGSPEEENTLYHITDAAGSGVGGSGVSYVIEVYGNSASGYRLWSDGYCEQWGVVNTPGNNSVTVTLLKPYSDINYVLSFSCLNASAVVDTSSIPTIRSATEGAYVFDKTTSAFKLVTQSPGYVTSIIANTVYWKASGYVI